MGSALQTYTHGKMHIQSSSTDIAIEPCPSQEWQIKITTTVILYCMVILPSVKFGSKNTLPYLLLWRMHICTINTNKYIFKHYKLHYFLHFLNTKCLLLGWTHAQRIHEYLNYIYKKKIPLLATTWTFAKIIGKFTAFKPWL